MTTPDGRDPGVGDLEPVRVADHPDRSRVEVWVGDVRAGFAAYRRSAGRIVFTHTVVDEAFGGRGLGGRLAAGALDIARAGGDTVVARCPFIAAYIARHPDYQDLLHR
ncbi:MAG TPA: GNAT family N-acetyltransferase [Micromonosporaceae bacterium]|nr:GNAT family N-acetyltransferase [Micromonosporaceae bacterium]